MPLEHAHRPGRFDPATAATAPARPTCWTITGTCNGRSRRWSPPSGGPATPTGSRHRRCGCLVAASCWPASPCSPADHRIGGSLWSSRCTTRSALRPSWTATGRPGSTDADTKGTNMPPSTRQTAPGASVAGLPAGRTQGARLPGREVAAGLVVYALGALLLALIIRQVRGPARTQPVLHAAGTGGAARHGGGVGRGRAPGRWGS